jgi:hypothetical protein
LRIAPIVGHLAQYHCVLAAETRQKGCAIRLKAMQQNAGLGIDSKQLTSILAR